METFNEKLMEPIKYYREEIKNKFAQEVTDFFDNLVTKSNIDIEKNKNLSKEYENFLSEHSKVNSKISRLKSISKIFFYISLIALFFDIFCIYNFIKYKSPLVVKILIATLIVIVGFYLKYKFFKEKINNLENQSNNLKEKSQQKLYECYDNMKELNKLMDSKYTLELINKYIPFVELIKNLI